MKFVIYGVGAIGGTLATRLVLSGYEVAGIARKQHCDAINGSGLTLKTPHVTETARFSCYLDPADVSFGPNDIIFLTMKTQDCQPALERLRLAGVRDQAIVCAQNGVANEQYALRLFPNVYGLMLMMPTTYMVPGQVNAFGSPKPGIFDIGRYPAGLDETVVTIVEALNASNFVAFAHQRVMQAKYSKLLLNLGNIVGAVLGSDADSGEISGRMRDEGEAVLRAANIEFGDVGAKNSLRDKLMQDMPIKGEERIGSSSTQSLARQTGTIETDYLNGEIVLLGRLHNVPTPVNTYFCSLAQHMVNNAILPGSISLQQVQKEIAALG